MKSKTNFKKNIILISILLLAITNSFAADIKSHLENADSLFIGTPFQLVVDINSAMNDSLFVPPIDTLDIFILAKEPVLNEVDLDDNTKKTSISFTFQPFDVGEFTLPAIDFMIRSNGELSSLKSDEYKLRIYSTVPDSVQVIADIAPVKSVYLGFWDYIAIIFTLLLIATAIYFLIKFIRKPKESIEQTVIIDDRSAYEICMEQIKMLKNDDFLRRGDFLSYYFRLSYIMRLFIELQFNVKALEMTTAEIRANLTDIDPKEKSFILNYLINCDKIKFAKFMPKLSEADTALDELENFIKSYKAKEDQDA